MEMLNNCRNNSNILTIEDLDNIDSRSLVNKVICGDAISVMKKMPDNFVHLIITSPPYNVGIKYDNYDDSLPYNEYLEFLENTWVECYRILVKGGRICVNVPSIRSKVSGGQYQALFCDVVNQMKKIGYLMRGDILWYKQNIQNRTAWGSWKSPSNPHLVYPYEFILVFSKETKKLDGDKNKIDITEQEFIKYSNAFWQINPQTKPNGHPAPFPEELAYRLIKFYSYQENIVLDPFAGSGTVGVVAIKTNRNYICIDKSMKYCKLAEGYLQYERNNLFSAV